MPLTRPLADPLVMKQAVSTLPWIGRILADTGDLPFWERDTRILPFFFRGSRRRYRRFAEERIRPLALDADRDPERFDPGPILSAAGRAGFQSELMVPPIGTMRLRHAVTSMTLAACLKAEEFCAACGGIGLTLLAHDLGVAPLLLCGDLATMFRWQWPIYKELRRGEPKVAAFAITEPSAGSDVEETDGAARARITTRARKGNGGWTLNGRKCFISNGAIAHWVTLFAAVEEGGVESWTCFLLERGMAGFSAGRKERKLGQRAADASELVLEDCFVPDRNVVGPLRGGWPINRNVLNFSRAPVGAIAVGIARGALEHALAFCRTTRLGGRPLAEYQEVQLALGEMMIQVQAMRATVWHAARSRIPHQSMSSAAKVFCGDTAVTVCSRAMELLGDHGYLHRQGVEKGLRDARLNQIYEGTNQINRLSVIEGQWAAEVMGAT